MLTAMRLAAFRSMRLRHLHRTQAIRHVCGIFASSSSIINFKTLSIADAASCNQASLFWVSRTQYNKMTRCLLTNRMLFSPIGRHHRSNVFFAPLSRQFMFHRSHLRIVVLAGRQHTCPEASLKPGKHVSELSSSGSKQSPWRSLLTKLARMAAVSAVAAVLVGCSSVLFAELGALSSARLTALLYLSSCLGAYRQLMQQEVVEEWAAALSPAEHQGKPRPGAINARAYGRCLL